MSSLPKGTFQFDNKGRLLQIPRTLLEKSGVNYSPLGAPRFGLKRLHYGDRLTTADPASHLASAITDGGEGVGISFPLNGSWGSTDWAGAYPYIIWNLTDVFNAITDSTSGTWFQLAIMLRATVPVAGDEFKIGLGIVSETDLTTGTIDGRGFAVDGTGANLTVQSFTVSNGTFGQAASAANNSIVGASGGVGILGSGGTNISASRSAALDSAGAFLTSGAAGAAVVNTTAGTRLYLALAAGRQSAGNTNNLTLNVDAYYSPALRHNFVV